MSVLGLQAAMGLIVLCADLWTNLIKNGGVCACVVGGGRRGNGLMRLGCSVGRELAW